MIASGREARQRPWTEMAGQIGPWGSQLDLFFLEIKPGRFGEANHLRAETGLTRRQDPAIIN